MKSVLLAAACMSDLVLSDDGCAADTSVLLQGQKQTIRKHQVVHTTQDGPGEEHYIGCFTDNRARDMGTWLGNRDNAATNTFAGCAAACDKEFMALQSGGECFCADSYGNGDAYRQVDDSECNRNTAEYEPCASNAFNCGGHWRQAIYRTPKPGAEHYIGCFTDNRARDMGTWLGNRDNAATNTFANCAAACDKEFMALQSGGECFCADSYGNGDAYRQVDDSECDRNTAEYEPCASNAHNCGGHWRQAIYQNPTFTVTCSVEAETSSQQYANSGTGASMQFSVGGVWSDSRVLATSIAANQVVTAEETLSGSPAAIRLIAGGDDAWGYRRLSVTCGAESWVLLDSENGASYGDNRYWVDGNQDAPEAQEYEVVDVSLLQDASHATSELETSTKCGNLGRRGLRYETRRLRSGDCQNNCRSCRSCCQECQDEYTPRELSLSIFSCIMACDARCSGSMGMRMGRGGS